MAVFHAPETPYAKELAKWEALPTVYAPVPQRPYKYEEFPKIVFKAAHTPQGPVAVTEFETALSESEQARLLDQGFHLTQEDALDAVTRLDREIATAAAERAYTDRHMSPQAQAEAARADAETDTHVAEIPRTPIVKRVQKGTA